MKLSQLFKPKRPVGWQGPSGSPNPVTIGAIVAVIIAGAYVALVVFGHRG